MYPRIYKPTKNKSFFLFGPRGTGKSTWIKSQYPQATLIDLNESENYFRLKSNPSRINDSIQSHTEWIVLDEIQRVPELLNEVHALIEKKKLKFALTGSSARKLKRGAANLLAGRAYQTYFYPLTLWELDSNFNLEKALKIGLLPSVWNSEEDPKRYLNAYIQTYLREEVQAEGLSRNLGNFSRFLEAMSYSQAQVLNMSTIARDVGVDSKVIANYLEILEDLLIAKRIPCFSNKAKRKMVSHPKFFYFDSGVFRTLRPKGPLDIEAELNGPALETLFFHHHQVWVESKQLNQKIYYWRTQAKHEVDFVSYGEAGFFGVEIKCSDRLRDEDFSTLKLFKEDYPKAQVYLLYLGHKKLTREGITILPFEEGIRKILLT